MQVPTDPRRQYSMMDIALAHAFGGGPTLDQVQETFPGSGRYVQPNAWPKPKPSPTTNSGFSSGLAASTPEPKPKSAAQILWPDMK